MTLEQVVDRLRKSPGYLKKGSGFLSERFNCSREVIKRAKEIICGHVSSADIPVPYELQRQFKEDISSGTAEVTALSPVEIRNLNQLIEVCDIDTTRWDITKYVQNFWGNTENPNWQVKAWLSAKTEAGLFQDNFIKFLSSYNPKIKAPFPAKSTQSPSLLVVNKQDSHYDKWDLYGENDLSKRFELATRKLTKILRKASSISKLEKIIYIIGSDEFNAEWTSTTTKGTPQKNIVTYEYGFQRVCDFEFSTLLLLLSYAMEVEVIYVPGNHDEYVGWHLAHWLKSSFKNEKRVTFDIENLSSKFVSYGRTAMMFNHGDAVKPSKLVNIFPVKYRERWSDADRFYVFTGDKHFGKYQDFNGIEFYQIPALSSARSKWDEKNEYIPRSEMTGFLIDKYEGLDILKV